MSELVPLKPLLCKEDLPSLSDGYLRLGLYLGRNDLPDATAGLRRDPMSGRLTAIPASQGRPLSPVEIMLQLKRKELVSQTPAIAISNAALAGYLGGSSLRMIHDQGFFERLEGSDHQFGFAKALATATGVLQRNMEEALSGRIEADLARDWLEQTGQLIYSRRCGVPDEKKRQRRR